MSHATTDPDATGPDLAPDLLAFAGAGAVAGVMLVFYARSTSLLWNSPLQRQPSFGYDAARQRRRPTRLIR